MDSILSRLFLAGAIFAVGLGGATTATIIGVANATYKYLMRDDSYLQVQAQQNSEIAERLLDEAEATRKAAEAVNGKSEDDGDQDEQTDERQTQERPEDRRTWAQSETPIPNEQLDSFLDRPEPVLPY